MRRGQSRNCPLAMLGVILSRSGMAPYRFVYKLRALIRRINRNPCSTEQGLGTGFDHADPLTNAGVRAMGGDWFSGSADWIRLTVAWTAPTLHRTYPGLTAVCDCSPG